MIFKKFQYSIKTFDGYKLVRAARQSELERCSKVVQKESLEAVQTDVIDIVLVSFPAGVYLLKANNGNT